MPGRGAADRMPKPRQRRLPRARGKARLRWRARRPQARPCPPRMRTRPEAKPGPTAQATFSLSTGGSPNSVWSAGSDAISRCTPPPASGTPTNEVSASTTSHAARGGDARERPGAAPRPRTAEKADASSAAGATTSANMASAWSGPSKLPCASCANPHSRSNASDGSKDDGKRARHTRRGEDDRGDGSGFPPTSPMPSRAGDDARSVQAAA